MNCINNDPFTDLTVEELRNLLIEIEVILSSPAIASHEMSELLNKLLPTITWKQGDIVGQLYEVSALLQNHVIKRFKKKTL